MNADYRMERSESIKLPEANGGLPKPFLPAQRRGGSCGVDQLIEQRTENSNFKGTGIDAIISPMMVAPVEAEIIGEVAIPLKM
jgi:hypothetical protein